MYPRESAIPAPTETPADDHPSTPIQPVVSRSPSIATPPGSSLVVETLSRDADSDVPNDSVGVSACNLFELISKSADKLFFICYTPADTLQPH